MIPSLRRRLLAIGLIALVALPACGRTFRPPAAVVHGAAITDEQLRHSIPQFQFLTSLSQRPCGQPTHGESQGAACSRFVLGQLIQEEIVAAYAGAHHLSVTSVQVLDSILPLEQGLGGRAALVKRLGQQGLTFGDLRELASNLLLVRLVERSVAFRRVTDRDLRRTYLQDRLQFTLIHVAHILVKTKAEADRIFARVTRRNFARLARRYSTDTGSASRGGDLGTTRATGLDPTFVRAALSLRPGQISGPVQTQFGWHVIRLISERVLPFSQVRGQLVLASAGPVFTAWLRARAGTGIDVNPRFGTFDPVSGRVVAITCTADAPAHC